MEAAAEDLEIRDAVVSVRGTPARSMALEEIAAVAYMQPFRLPQGMRPGLEHTTRFAATGITYSNATHVCVCEIDTNTGMIRVVRYIVSEDCGVMINPGVVEGQIAGGVAQGIGGVLLEHSPCDDAGNVLASTYLDYLLPTISDIPRMEFDHVVTPSVSPGGFKGMGEGGAMVSPAAVLNAIADALAPLGIPVNRQPVSPSEILGRLKGS
jgi:carbon-monoxide dehydrogenase large subunit